MGKSFNHHNSEDKREVKAARKASQQRRTERRTIVKVERDDE